MSSNRLTGSARLKLDLMFDGLRYSEALGAAAANAFPNYYPYRFQPHEKNPTGKQSIDIPYLIRLEDGTLVRIKGNPDSPWRVMGEAERGYTLVHDSGPQTDELSITFEPLPGWMTEKTLDGFDKSRAGVSLHGDMAVINVAPGCDYFLEKDNDGRSLRCTFCAYGAPNERISHFGQQAGHPALPAQTYARMRETLHDAIADGHIRHIYLVAGSLPDWQLEGDRFLSIAREVQEVVRHRIPVACGSGALPSAQLQRLFDEQLVDAVCFNLEVWSEPLFSKVCPGKQKFVGYHRWIESLERAVELWGEGRVYSAMVAGVELEPVFGMSWQEAADLAIQGAEDLCARGIIPIYSLYWPIGGRDHPDYFDRLLAYFEKLNLAYLALRRRYALQIWEGFMCHRCAYMQLECDLDRSPAGGVE